MVYVALPNNSGESNLFAVAALVSSCLSLMFGAGRKLLVHILESVAAAEASGKRHPSASDTDEEAADETVQLAVVEPGSEDGDRRENSMEEQE